MDTDRHGRSRKGGLLRQGRQDEAGSEDKDEGDCGLRGEMTAFNCTVGAVRLILC
jgi:hypothetical protein